MDKHNNVPRGNANISTPMLENYNAPPSTYNIPQEFLGESQSPVVNQTQNQQIPTRDKILNSKFLRIKFDLESQWIKISC